MRNTKFFFASATCWCCHLLDRRQYSNEHVPKTCPTNMSHKLHKWRLLRRDSLVKRMSFECLGICMLDDPLWMTWHSAEVVYVSTIYFKWLQYNLNNSLQINISDSFSLNQHLDNMFQHVRSHLPKGAGKTSIFRADVELHSISTVNVMLNFQAIIGKTLILFIAVIVPKHTSIITALRLSNPRASNF